MKKTRFSKLATCLLCGPVQCKIMIKGNSFGFEAADVVRCPHCHLWWIDPLPSPSQIVKFYPPEYYGIQNEKFNQFLEAFVQLFRRLRAEKAMTINPRGKRVLDIGCGRGQSLKILQQHGYECYGTELSPFSAGKAASLPGLHIFARPLLDCRFPDHFFDPVLLWHVFEHLPNPQEILQEIFRILAPGGTLLLCVPNIESLQARLTGSNWFHLDLPRHLYQYTPNTITAMLASSGFHLVHYHTFSMEQGPFGLLQSILNILGFPRNTLYQMLHRTASKQNISFFSRLLQTETFLLFMPITIWISYFFSLLGQGGVIEVQAKKPLKRERSIA